MSTRHPTLSDALLNEALTRRSAGGRTPVALVGDVMAAIETVPQRRGWAVWVTQQRPLVVVLVALLLVSMLVAIGLVGGQLVTRPASVGEIAFVHATYDFTGQADPSDPVILTVSSEGGEPVRLLGVPGSVQPPISSGGLTGVMHPSLIGPAVEWSPDGTRLAFRLFNDVPGIYLMNRDGTGLTRLVELPSDSRVGMPFSSALDWSPDGTKIAYTYPYRSLSSRLYVVDVDHGGVTDLFGDDDSRRANRTVAWSPDGSRIILARSNLASLERRVSELFVMNADGTGERRLFAGFSGQANAVAWSPDGSRLALLRNGNPATDIGTLQVVNADGTGLRDLAQLWLSGCCIFESLDEPLAWSPDGRLIAMVDARGEQVDEGSRRDVIVLVNADGSGERVLTAGGSFDWSPDGSRLVVSDAGGAHVSGAGFDSYSIWVINADGTGRRWLAEGEYPTWSPGS